MRCHYFKLPQRHEDRVLEVLVKKTETIRRELGSLGKVIDEDIEKRLTKGGIRRREANALAAELENFDLGAEQKRVVTDEFEAVRERQRELQQQIERCRNLLEKSRNWVRFQPDAFRQALSCSLRIQDAGPLRKEQDAKGRDVWRLPELAGRVAADPSWAATLDTLRVPIKRDQKPLEWRKEAPIRPVVFKDAGELTEDVVHLHSGAASRPTLARPLSRPGIRSQRSFPGLSGACRGFGAPRGPVGSVVLVRRTCRALARGDCDRHGTLDRAPPADRPPHALRDRRGTEDARPPGRGSRTRGGFPAEQDHSGTASSVGS